MKKLEKVFNRITLTSILGGLGFILIGLFLLLKPDISIKTLTYLLSISFIISGLFSIFYNSSKDIRLVMFDGLINGIICLLLGIILLLQPMISITLIPIIVGIWFIICGSIKTRLSYYLIRFKDEMGVFTFIMGLLIIICGFLMIFNPLEGIFILTESIGIIMIIYGCSTIIETSIIRMKIDSFKNILKL